MSSVCLTSPTQGENLIHIHAHTRGMDAMFSPLDFPEPLEEPRRREGRFSFFLLHVPPSLGHRGAILGISLIRIAPSPHGAFERALSQ